VRFPEQNKPGACLQALLPKLLREKRERERAELHEKAEDEKKKEQSGAPD
jgi:hypothetical protein